MVVALFQPDYLVTPAQVDRRKILYAIHQIGFGIELLEIDESGSLVALLGQQIKLIKLRRTVENLADAPYHPLVDHAAADAEPVPVLEGALGETDRARPLADPVGIIEQHDGLAALRQIDRERQPDRSGADHHDGMFGSIRASPILIGVTAIAELGFGLRHALNVALAKGRAPA